MTVRGELTKTGVGDKGRYAMEAVKIGDCLPMSIAGDHKSYVF
jgi:hypothetical protein